MFPAHGIHRRPDERHHIPRGVCLVSQVEAIQFAAPAQTIQNGGSLLIKFVFGRIGDAALHAGFLAGGNGMADFSQSHFHGNSLVPRLPEGGKVAGLPVSGEKQLVKNFIPVFHGIRESLGRHAADAQGLPHFRIKDGLFRNTGAGSSGCSIVVFGRGRFDKIRVGAGGQVGIQQIHGRLLELRNVQGFLRCSSGGMGGGVH